MYFLDQGATFSAFLCLRIEEKLEFKCHGRGEYQNTAKRQIRHIFVAEAGRQQAHIVLFL